MRYTLVSDGPTDANLVPIINWTLDQAAGIPVADGRHAELWRLNDSPKTLKDRILKALDLYPCDVLFIHRDAEKQNPEHRNIEIQKAWQNAQFIDSNIPAVAVIPVRMLEAWLLFDEAAIRKAAGNPQGRIPLDLPQFVKAEELPNPKSILHEALRTASELKGRRLKKFSSQKAFWRLADYLEDFTPLRQLAAFKRFENCVRSISNQNWKPGFYGCEAKD